ncbi:TlpA family protein disulfide reductase [Shewanella sp. YIC-542]|uniref:TlpA family protein disulfide reductase n=1 Tax=Shewanella mytili TaxID=3377111 RepID=UPI00398E33A1
MNRVIRLLLLSVGISVFPALAAPQQAEYLLQDLRGQHHTSLATLPGNTVAVMFFKPDCPWCHKQAKALDKLHQQCAFIHPVALGVNGNKLALKKALFNLQFPYPGYMAPRNLIADLGGIPATPITLLLQQGNVIAAFRGFTPAETLAEQLACNHEHPGALPRQHHQHHG